MTRTKPPRSTDERWPGGDWGSAFATVRRGCRFTQADIAEYLAIPTRAVKAWEAGRALPERSQWPMLEEALGLRIPDPRTPSPEEAKDDLLHALLALTDEVRSLREVVATASTPPATPEHDRMLTVAEAAEYLGLTKSAVYGEVGHQIPRLATGRRIRFRRSDLDAWLADNTKAAYRGGAGCVGAVRGRRPT
jgi:excisionase family DNA binding protein